jgi:hypothetical protein
VIIDPTFGAPGINLTHLFFSAMGANQGANVLLFDDFYVSTGGFNSTIPVAASTFVKVEPPPGPPAEIKIQSFTLNAGTKSFTFAWSSKAGATYSVLKKSSLGDPWQTVATGYPTGGATGDSTSFNDSNASESAAFYQISQTP